MAAYYNEIEPFAVAWLRELIKRGLIADGVVDDRPIEVVEPSDLTGHEQCHFFAGIGVWSFALRNAGWADDARVWTGSCPCQPFSASGKGEGFDDSRHLWPAWHRLIRECRPHVVFGEQVANSAGLAWFDPVSADLEGSGYAIGAADIPAAGVGAPHIRQRLYFVAESQSNGAPDHAQARQPYPERNSATSGAMADTPSERIKAGPEGERREARNLTARNNERMGDPASERCGKARDGHRGRRSQWAGDASESGVVADPECNRRRPRRPECEGLERAAAPVRTGSAGRLDDADDARLQRHRRPLAVNDTGGREGAERHERSAGFWDDAIWLPCRDGKARPVEPGTFPLAPSTPDRVGRLRGYGNAINAEVARAFIEAYLDVRGEA